MSPRKPYSFLSGTAVGLVAGAIAVPAGDVTAAAAPVYLLLGSTSPTASTVTNTETPSLGRTDEARAPRTQIATTQGCRISGTVQISANLVPHAAPDTTLFIYATDVISPGPPLAVLRLRVERWPVSFVLDDADAMIPGRNLSASRSVQLEARVSPGGEALPRPGDLVGTVANLDPHTTHSVNISIDRQIT